MAAMGMMNEVRAAPDCGYVLRGWRRGVRNARFPRGRRVAHTLRAPTVRRRRGARLAWALRVVPASARGAC